MSHDVFMQSVERISQGAMTFPDLVGAAEAIAPQSPQQARQLYHMWLGSHAGSPMTAIGRFNASVLADQLGDFVGAQEDLRASLAADPSFAPAWINLGGLMERLGAAGAAVETWRSGLQALDGVNGVTIGYKLALLKRIAKLLADNNEYEVCETALTMMLDIDPHQRDVTEQLVHARMAQCTWAIAAPAGRASRSTLLAQAHPLSMCAYTDDPLLQLAASARYVRAVCPIAERTRAFDRSDAMIHANRPLRVGYVSSDLRRHAVGYLFAEVPELHDAAKVETFAYVCGPQWDDPFTTRAQQAFHHWRSISGLSDDQAAALIAADEIDILVDVNGHTREARLGVFARRPAPIQVNWLGYPGSMGSSFHDYIIADPVIIPPDAEMFYSEQVMRLACYQPNDRRRIADDAPLARAEHGLPEDAFVFCCFNASHKLTRETFERFMDILRAVPHSVLWLLDAGAKTNARLHAEAVARGVAADRLIFAARAPNAAHLSRYRLADLVLDTAPYGAHTTASDALWVGAPVLTFTGRCFAARVCASLVAAAGAPELVCPSPQDFVAQAIAYATSQRPHLHEIRARLAAQRDTCTLFDTPRLVHDLEALYGEMAQRHRAGVRHKPQVHALDAYFDVGVSLEKRHRDVGARDDYLDLYRTALADRAHFDPLPADGRLIGASDAAPAQDALGETTANSPHRAAA